MTYCDVFDKLLHITVVAENRGQVRTVTARLLLKLVVNHRPAIAQNTGWPKERKPLLNHH